MSEVTETITVEQAKRPFFLGVDVGGTNIKIGLVDDNGSMIVYRSIPTEEPKGPADAFVRVKHVLAEIVSTLGINQDEVKAAGLATPGTMDIPAGMLLEPHNLPHWYNFPVKQTLEDQLGIPVTFVNDANAAAFGEYWIGSGREFCSMVLLTIGTGVGGGIIVNDVLVDGEHSHGSECGHIIIDMNDDAREIPTGQKGHLEAYASGTAIIKRTAEALEVGRQSSLSARIEAGESLSPLMVSQEADQGDELSLEIVLETARYLGIGIVSLMHTIDPGAVVLGGAIDFGGHDTSLGCRFLGRIKEEVQKRAFPVPAEKTVVDFARLGGDAGYLGAAGTARAQFHRDSQKRAQ
ncbi:MAG: glucokinase [Blastopirellula sp.]|nr:MAG: glucokinase [Blastopirellula sp.]